jgi:hypothetical protein
MELSPVELSPPMGHPASPFICEGEGTGYTIERQREKRGGRGPLGSRRPSSPLCGSRRSVDDDGDGSTSWPYSPLAPHAGIISRSWRPIPSWRGAWSTGTPDESRTGVRQHSVGSPDPVGDVSSQVCPVMAMGHVETCPLPSWCQKFDPRFALLHP